MTGHFVLLYDASVVSKVETNKRSWRRSRVMHALPSMMSVYRGCMDSGGWAQRHRTISPKSCSFGHNKRLWPTPMNVSFISSRWPECSPMMSVCWRSFDENSKGHKNPFSPVRGDSVGGSTRRLRWRSPKRLRLRYCSLCSTRSLRER